MVELSQVFQNLLSHFITTTAAQSLTPTAMALARGVNVSIEPEVSDNNIFYADNVAAETAGGIFMSGTATLQGLTAFLMRPPNLYTVLHGQARVAQIITNTAPQMPRRLLVSAILSDT